nr:hypothetical protein [Tanacetum cinerariifolium]
MYVRVVSKRLSEKFLGFEDANISLTSCHSTSKSSLSKFLSKLRKLRNSWIMVEEPKPLKKQAQIEHDEAYARELEPELNKNINWNDVIEQVQRKEKEDNVVLRYQALKRKPQT